MQIITETLQEPISVINEGASFDEGRSLDHIDMRNIGSVAYKDACEKHDQHEMLEDKSTIVIRQLTASDAVIFRDLRVEAITKTNLFISLFRDERNEAIIPISEFELLLADVGSRAFFGAFSANSLVGIAGIYLDSSKRDEQTACLGAAYVKENYRNKNIWSKLFDVRVGYAVAKGLTQIVTQCRVSNTSIQQALIGRGFQLIGICEGLLCSGEVVQGYEFGRTIPPDAHSECAWPARDNENIVATTKTPLLALRK